MKRSAVPLTLLHLLGNALQLWFGYYWLGVSESDTAHLLWSALVLLGGVCASLDSWNGARFFQPGRAA